MYVGKKTCVEPSELECDDDTRIYGFHEFGEMEKLVTGGGE